MCSATTRWPKRKPPGRRRLAHREDWRHVPLITIDPPDAKDHDDAVHAEPDTAGQQSWRLHRQRRHRRRRPLRDARLGARPRSAGARQFGLFPRPRGADAAGAHLQRSVLAASARRPRRARRAHGDRRRRPQALAHVPPRHDALGRQAVLPTGAIRHRRAHRRGHRGAGRAGARPALRGLRNARRARASNAGRSISICRNGKSCSRATAPSTASPRRNGWRRTG